MSFINDILTDASGHAFDVIRVLAVATIAVALGLELYAVIAGKAFDCQAFGIGMGAVFVAVGGALKLTEVRPGITTTATATTTTTEAP